MELSTNFGKSKIVEPLDKKEEQSQSIKQLNIWSTQAMLILSIEPMLPSLNMLTRFTATPLYTLMKFICSLKKTHSSLRTSW